MRKLSMLFITILILLLILAVVPAAASSPPLDVEIEADSLFTGTGEFTATGPAMDDGIVCAAGDTLDVFSKVTGNGNNGFNIQVMKEFTCDDGSGSFLVKLQVKVFFSSPRLSSFNWTVMGGDGVYLDLHGSGNGVVLPPNTGYDTLDVYT